MHCINKYRPQKGVRKDVPSIEGTTLKIIALTNIFSFLSPDSLRPGIIIAQAGRHVENICMLGCPDPYNESRFKCKLERGTCDIAIFYKQTLVTTKSYLIQKFYVIK